MTVKVTWKLPDGTEITGAAENGQNLMQAALAHDVPGIIGEFMTYLPQTLIITLSCSLFVGLFINPVLCSTMMKVSAKKVGQ